MTSLTTKLNNVFWWPGHDWVTYMVPVEEGKVILPHHFLVPGYEINVTEHWYSFIHSRRDRPKKKIADFSGWSRGAFFVNERAYEVFEDMFLRHGRPFPVRCSNKPHYIVLIDTMHDAIDMEKSEFRRLGLHEKLEDDISQTTRLVIRKDFKTADDIFRIDRCFALSLEIVVSDAFKVRYEQSGLTGLFFLKTCGS